METELILSTLGHVDSLTGIFGTTAAVAAWLRLRAFDRLDEPVAVKLLLATEGREVTVPLEMRRRDLSRAELLGRLAMFVRGGGRMSLAALSDPATLGTINAVAAGNSDTLVLSCSDAELAQFNL